LRTDGARRSRTFANGSRSPPRAPLHSFSKEVQVTSRESSMKVTADYYDDDVYS
jgi:hypothetical protein